MSTVNDSASQASGIIQALQLGSGVDIQALARNLAEAENAPRIEQVTARQDSVEARISGYGLLSTGLDSLRQGFSSLGSYSGLRQNSVEGVDPSVLAASVDANARAGSYEIDVTRLATSQTVRSNSFSSTTQSLNSGAAFSLNVTVGASNPTLHTVNITDATPAGVVNAVNSADIGISATLVNKSAAGDDWYILLQGETGTENSFSVAAVAGLGFDDAANQLTSAGNAQLSVNGLTQIERASNTIDDVITGLSMSLKKAGGDTQLLTVSQSTEPLRFAINDLVIRFNDLQTITNDLTNPDSQANDYSGSLARDKALANALMREARALFEIESGSPSGGLITMKDLGLSFQRDGSLALDGAVFGGLLAAQPDDVLQMLTAGNDSENSFSTDEQGLATDLAAQLEGILDNNGMVQLRINAAQDQVDDYQTELDRLEQRLEAARVRYVQQFAAMEAFVERTQGIGDYLEGQFEAMNKMYD